MPSLWTKRYIIVCRQDMATLANTAAKDASWDNDGQGDKTFTAPLSATGNLPATAYWCSTALKPAQATAVRNRLLAMGATSAEATPIPAAGSPASTRFAIFDSVDWTPAQVLTTLGLQRITTVP